MPEVLHVSVTARSNTLVLDVEVLLKFWEFLGRPVYVSESISQSATPVVRVITSSVPCTITTATERAAVAAFSAIAVALQWAVSLSLAVEEKLTIIL